jgi:DNA polymerase III alpha subunit (gram-positive type)
MILAAVDIESTGLDKQNDRIIEMGLVLYSTGQNKILESTGFLVNSDGVKISDEITGLTGVTQGAVDRFGYPQQDAIETFNAYVEQADAVIGHNILWFDLPMIRNTAKRLGINLVPTKLEIDSMTDLPGTKGEQLVTMCAKAGFLNPNAHSAEDDAKAVVKLVSNYNIEEVAARAASPTLVILSQQGRSQAENKAARKAGFRWNPDFRVWWNAVKEMDVQALAAKVPFAIAVAPKEISLEQLRND